MLHIHVLDVFSPSLYREANHMYIYLIKPLLTGVMYPALSCLSCRFHIPMSDEVDDVEVKKDPLMMKAVKAFKANYVSPIQLR